MEDVKLTKEDLDLAPSDDILYSEALHVVTTEVTELRLKVEQLEQHVGSLEGELRLIKRKFRTLDPNRDEYQKIIEKTFLALLDNQNWRISRYDESRESRHSVKRSNPTETGLGMRSRGSSKKSKEMPKYLSESDDCASAYNDDDDDDYIQTISIATSDISDTENMKPKNSSVTSIQKTRKSRKSKKNSDSKSTAVNLEVASMKYEQTQAPGSENTLIRDGDVAVILDNNEFDTQIEEKGPSTRSSKRSTSKYPRPKKVQCSLCPKLFRDNFEVTRHELTHTDVKPYSCYQCIPEVRFRQIYHLQRHTARRHKLPDGDKIFIKNG